MEPRLIYESNKAYHRKIDWTRGKDTDSEWHYFDLTEPSRIKDIITSFINTHTLHISLGRQNSFTIDKASVFDIIKPMLGTEELVIWNESFTMAIEISEIGVYRAGARRE